MIKTVIFDLGGVLVRTENQQPRRVLAEKHGMTYQDLSALVYGCESAELATRGAITAEEHKETVLKELGLSAGTFSSFRDEFWGGDSLDKYLVEFIRSLQAEYKTALLSNAWDDLRPLLENLWEIDGIFDQIFISGELKVAKPDPEIFQIVIDSLNQDPAELIFIDDFLENIVAARKEGMNAIHFRNRDQVLFELAEYLDLDI
ncbi:MAG: HAD family phosphatase [Anaerolineales bacterium]|nr:HAD family phosphatase [Anaerolineales bacterium]